MAEIGITRFGKFFSSGAMYVASLEKFHHQEILREIENEWGKLKCQMRHIHSTDDKIVPFGNTDYTKKMFTSAELKIIKLNEGNHFLPWNHFELIRSNILEIINESFE